jgi:hypothetical protein
MAFFRSPAVTPLSFIICETWSPAENSPSKDVLLKQIHHRHLSNGQLPYGALLLPNLTNTGCRLKPSDKIL